jgi:hypothetical protein
MDGFDDGNKEIYLKYDRYYAQDDDVTSSDETATETEGSEGGESSDDDCRGNEVELGKGDNPDIIPNATAINRRSSVTK